MNTGDLIKHYAINYKTKVFMTKLSSKLKDSYIMYIYQYENELKNFADTFLVYLPYYVRNKDYFETIDMDADLDSQLIERSKCIRQRSFVVPTRNVETDGIYGELFLDFYLRVVCLRKPVLTYANKRSFDSNKETTGPDNVVYYLDERKKINVCLCETKFVGGAANAKNKLMEDITGTDENQGHVTKEYLNNYFQFIVEKGDEIEKEDKINFQTFFMELNMQLDNGNDFVSIIIKHNICVNFVFFAIFDSQKKLPDKLNDYYNEIHNQCEINIKEIGIKNYKIEIIFIPTNNSSINIKKAMERSYE